MQTAISEQTLIHKDLRNNWFRKLAREIAPAAVDKPRATDITPMHVLCEFCENLIRWGWLTLTGFPPPRSRLGAAPPPFSARRGPSAVRLCLVGLCLLSSTVVAGGCLVPPAEITRADLADSYLKFESTLREYPPPASQSAELNRAFDRASIVFFTGRLGQALQEINQLADTLLPAAQRSAERSLLESLKLRPEPRVAIAGSGSVALELASLYAAPASPVREFRGVVRLRDAAQAVVIEQATSLNVDALGFVMQTLTLDSAKLAAGSYTIELALGEVRVSKGRLAIVERALDSLSAANVRRLDAVATPSAALRQALEICRARNSLLSDDPSEIDSAEFLIDPRELAREIEAELTQLEAQQNPYARRAGQTWRVIPGGSAAIPMWIYAPPGVTGEDAMPLVVAFHGAGGDERMFMDGYGAGELLRLADARGFLVASPLTNPFLRDPAAFDRLRESLSIDYAIDVNRVYVVGHSLGAGVASILSGQRPDAIAAACCIAGGRGFDAYARIAPTLVISGALDPINPTQATQSAAQQAIEKGLPLEFRRIEDAGHTLIVGQQLPAALDWMFSRRLSDAARATTHPAHTPQAATRPR